MAVIIDMVVFSGAQRVVGFVARFRRVAALSDFGAHFYLNFFNRLLLLFCGGLPGLEMRGAVVRNKVVDILDDLEAVLQQIYSAAVACDCLELKAGALEAGLACERLGSKFGDAVTQR